jgi:actin-like ATPase involved in cell morphogenesis
MGYWLGIDVGSTVTAAAVCRAGDPARVVALGDDAVVVPSVLYVGEQGEVVVGQAALDRGVADPDRVVRGFVSRVGDQVPLVCGGQTYTAAQLVAMVIGWAVQRVTDLQGGPAEGLMVTHPAGWGDYKCQVLATALDTVELPAVRLCAQPQAAVAGSGGAGTTVVVYDLGGSSCAATVVHTSDTGQSRVMGSPPAVAQLGGADFDDAVFGQVLATVPALACLDADDPATLAATVALRRACTRAKEALSAETEVTIPVTAPGIDTSVRVHRAEFDDLIRPQLAETLSLLRRALHSAQLDPTDLDAVLLVGGSARIPLVAQLVSTELNQPVTIDTDPATTIARGAATLARDAAAMATLRNVADPEPEPSPQPPHLPQRPALTAIPLDIEPADTQRQTDSRRRSRIVVAGALALLTAAAVAAVPFLLARSEANPSANAGPPPAGDQRLNTTPTPSAPPAADSANAGLSGEVSSRTAGSGEVVRTTTASPGAPDHLAAAPAKPNPPVAPASAAPSSWVTTYTWTTSWSSPPPAPIPTTTPSTDPPATTTTSARPTTTTTAPTAAQPAPPTKPSPSQQRKPTT